MTDFETWYSELTSDQIWFEPASMAHKPETFKQAARKVYMQCVADGQIKPVQESRKHVYNIVCKVPPDAKAKTWFREELQKREEAKKQESWQPVTEEERDQWLKKWKESISKLQTQSAVPRISYKELAEEGGILPPKPAPYPTTTKEEAYVRDRHFEYIKQNYEPKTGMKLPGWVSEDEWNIQYDNDML